VIEQILPAAVASVEAFADSPDSALFPEEQSIIARAVDTRRREFATGRACARSALAQLGVAPVPILRGERNAPQWPAGIVGSITHCAGYRAAAVARAGELLGVGIDAEPNQPLPDGVLRAIALPPEHAALRTLPAGTAWDRLLFCAKEAIFKVWFPLTAAPLGFDGARITIHPIRATFEARLLVPSPNPLVPACLAGRWLATSTHLLAAIALPREMI
jgi:4'-phosphopantetheinyl transferase EntD